VEKLLVVDDGKDMCWKMSNILRDAGFDSIAVSDGKTALQKAGEESPALVLLDLKMPRMNGIEVLKRLKEMRAELPVVMITAHGDISSAVEAMRLGAHDFVTKPFNNDALVLTIRRALEAGDLSRQVKQLKQRLGEQVSGLEVMGESPAIQRVLNQVKRVAPTTMTVILQGESGTGKDLIAQLVHHHSPRREQPLVSIDCGTLPETLMESELFGYEKGAFTGAETRREGRLEQANGGSLFLDEVANLTEPAQRRFLRVLEEKRFQRLGGRVWIEVDVRIVVASNKPLREEVKADRFREDLYYRLDQFQIEIPPLRSRREDLPVLCQVFLKEANTELDKQIQGISSEAMKVLLSYPWPGNVRELKNVMRRATLMAMDQILPEHLLFEAEKQTLPAPGEAQQAGLPSLVSADGPGSDAGDGDPAPFRTATRRVKEEAERSMILKALAETQGNKSQAAHRLGLERSVLYYKMRRLGITRHG